MYTIKPCKTKAVYNAIPDKKLRLDLDDCIKRLEVSGYKTIFNANAILIIKKDIETSIYPDGKLILKCDDFETARKECDSILDILGVKNNNQELKKWKEGIKKFLVNM